MWIRPDSPCECCGSIEFLMDDTGLRFTCVRCDTVQQYQDGGELTRLVIEGINNYDEGE